MARIHSITTDEVFTLVREAILSEREAGYQRGRWGMGDDNGVKAEQATERADKATVAMWRGLHTYAERIGQ